MSICHRTVKHKKNLKCTLRCSYMSSTNHQLTLNPYHRPFMVLMHALSTTHPMSKITRSAISRKPINQNRKKKFVFWRIYFYTFILVLDLKIKMQMAENHCLTFWTCVKLTLNSPPNGPQVSYSKIQNRLSRAP